MPARKTLAPPYPRAYADWVDAAVRPETRARRIDESVERLTRGLKLGLK